jgi:hypothetical protein
MPNALWFLVEWCWQQNPAVRPTAALVHNVMRMIFSGRQSLVSLSSGA